jgi:hypothetical protein
MTEERTVVDTFDINSSKATIAEAVEGYSTGPETGRLMWATRPNQGAKHTLVDATATNGNVEIDFYKLDPFGWRLRITAIQRPRANRADGPTVLSHAKGIAAAIKHNWVPVRPDTGATVEEWCEYIFQVREVKEMRITYKELEEDSRYSPFYLKKKYNEMMSKRGNKR